MKKTSIILILFIAIFCGCNKDDLLWDLKKIYRIATVSTINAQNISNTGATINCEVKYDGGDSVKQRGVCWSANQNPTIADNIINNGSALGLYRSALSNLNANTTYYVRAYALNGVGIAYGNQINFTTTNISGSTPTLTTTSASSINNNSALSGGNITSDGGASLIQRGICWSTNQNPTIVDNITSNGIGLGSFTSALSNLNANTIYYVRAYASNGVGTSYGNQINFTSNNVSGSPPILATASASSITNSSAVSGGNITSNGGSTITQRGVCWSANQNPTVADNKTNNGTGSGSFTSVLSNLNANTIYYVRAYATNGIGTSYGNQVSFTSSAPDATLVGSNNCSLLNGISSSFGYWNGTAYDSSAWSISGAGYSGSCWVAPDPNLTSTAYGTHYVEFNTVFSNNGYIEFWLNTNKPGYSNIFPTLYVDGIAQASPSMIGGQASSFYFMQVRSASISAGNHTVRIEFVGNYYVFKIDEISFYEY